MSMPRLGLQLTGLRLGGPPRRVVHCMRAAFDVHVGRPSLFGNPFILGRHGDRPTVVARYRRWLLTGEAGDCREATEQRRRAILAALPSLRGKTLGCWCAPKLCHGDVLAELANQEEGGMREIIGELEDHWTHYEAICCTTNSELNRHGGLVMGAGVARWFAHQWPHLSKEWGRRVGEFRGREPLVLVSRSGRDIQPYYLIYFQTKRDWRQLARYRLVRRSMWRLGEAIQLLGIRSVLLPRPGCGRGGLDWEQQVRPRLEQDFEWDRPPFNRITFIGKEPQK